MESNNIIGINKQYILAVSVLTFVFPFLCSAGEIFFLKEIPFTLSLYAKWFIFSAVGLRLFIAGIKQTTNPAFTAKEIFHLQSAESFPIVRELGFVNLCFGLIGIVSVFMPQWRIVSAFGSGLYYGIAGVQHLFKKSAGANEKFALVTDIIIFIFLLAWFVKMI